MLTRKARHQGMLRQKIKVLPVTIKVSKDIISDDKPGISSTTVLHRFNNIVLKMHRFNTNAFLETRSNPRALQSIFSSAIQNNYDIEM